MGNASRALGDPGGHGLALDVAHCLPQPSILLTNGVAGNEPGVIELNEDAAFAPEAVAHPRVVGDGGVEEAEGDAAVGRWLGGQEDDAGGAAP